MKTPRTPLLRMLLRAYHKSLSTRTTEDRARRRFVKQTALATAALPVLPLLNACSSQPDDRRKEIHVAVLGAGLSGLVAAYYLKKAGIRVSVYEASDMAGGRIRTANGLLADGITTELGGEFIDTGHEDMFTLVKEFNLELLDMQSDSELRLIQEVFNVNGVSYSEEDVVTAFEPFVEQISLDAEAIPEDIGFEMVEAYEHDNMSIPQYLESIGVDGWLRSLLETAYTAEMGIESSDQSALNFLYMIGTDIENGLSMYGDSDERFKIRGGNQQLTDALAASLGGDIYFNHYLEAILSTDGEVKLRFNEDRTLSFSYAICTIPFSVLRHIEFQSPISETKRKVIDELGYGTNSKVMLGMRDRVWRKTGHAGYVFGSSVQNGWDSSQMQKGNQGPGGYTVFVGGLAGRAVDNDSMKNYSVELDKIFTGFVDARSERASLFAWHTNALSRGSYSAYRVGQYSSLCGAESIPVGNLLFAGEHCSLDFQGYMNGAAESGRVAAEAVIESLSISGKR